METSVSPSYLYLDEECESVRARDDCQTSACRRFNPLTRMPHDHDLWLHGVHTYGYILYVMAERAFPEVRVVVPKPGIIFMQGLQR